MLSVSKIVAAYRGGHCLVVAIHSIVFGTAGNVVVPADRQTNKVLLIGMTCSQVRILISQLFK